MAFDTIAERALSHVKGTGTLLRHRESGAEVVAVQNSDPELVFGVIFETIPECANGVAHLLEHLIFRGSKRYPETHLYAKLVQGTFLTGLNASTGADSTLFHHSSADPDDFANLIDVMLDAVFHPLLRKVDFLEERNVVMNEMAGHHAVPANRILERLRHELLTESVYAVDHGGDPQMIAALTQTDLQGFHAVHYQPAQARFFLWGNFDLAARLDQLHQSLDTTTKTPETAISAPTRLYVPTHRTATYPAPETGPKMTGFGWAFDTKQPDLWQAIALALMAKPEGPVMQALQNHGGRIIGPGFSKDTPLGTFEIALVDHPETEQLNLTNAVDQALLTLMHDRSVEQQMRNAIERCEFDLRGFGSRAYGPTGLRALNMIRRQWQHGADPLALLDVEARAAQLRETVATDPQAITRTITADLLDNPHRVVVSLQPDGTKPHTDIPETYAKMACDPSVVAQTSPLPFVVPEDLKLSISSIAFETESNVLHVPDPRPDLARADLAISLSGLTGAQLDIVLVLEVILENQLACEGLEISTRCWAAPCNGKTGAAWLSISGRSLPAQSAQLLQFICGVLRFPDPTVDVLVRQIRARIGALDAQLAAFGHQFCETRLRANHSLAGTLNEWLSGLHKLHALKKALALKPQDCLKMVGELRRYLVDNAEMTLAISGIAPTTAQNIMQDCRPRPVATTTTTRFDLPAFQSIATGAANFTTGQAIHLSDTGPAHVAAHMLETGWLWDSVRVAGGAYSVRCNYNTDDRLMTLLSIRDPSPRRTLDHISQAPVWLRSAADSDILARCVAAKMGHLTRPVRPDDTLSTVLQRHLCGQTDDMRQAEFEHIRRVDAGAMRQLAQSFEAALKQASTVVLGPPDGLAALA